MLFLLIVNSVAGENSNLVLDGLQEQYHPDDEKIKIDSKKPKLRFKDKQGKNRLKPAFPEKNLEEEFKKKRVIDRNEIFDEFSVVPENPEIQGSSQSSISLDDFSTHTKLVSITPFRLIAGRKLDVYFELQPTTFKIGYGRFGEHIVNCTLDSHSKMNCPSPYLKPGEIKVSFSRDRRSWTNSVPAFVYRTNYTIHFILTILLFAFGLGGIILAFAVLNGGFQPKISGKKPAALLNRASGTETV